MADKDEAKWWQDFYSFACNAYSKELFTLKNEADITLFIRDQNKLITEEMARGVSLFLQSIENKNADEAKKRDRNKLNHLLVQQQKFPLSNTTSQNGVITVIQTAIHQLDNPASNLSKTHKNMANRNIRHWANNDVKPNKVKSFDGWQSSYKAGKKYLHSTSDQDHIELIKLADIIKYKQETLIDMRKFLNNPSRCLQNKTRDTLRKIQRNVMSSDKINEHEKKLILDGLILMSKLK